MSRDFIQSAVDQILEDYPPPKGIDFGELQRLLADLKPKPIDLQASMPKGIFRGVSYQFDSFKWPGSKIGREYSVGLVERGVRMPSTKSDSTTQTHADHGSLQAPTAAPTPQPARDKYARAPGALRQILRDGSSANRMVPLGVRPIRQFSDRLPGIDMKKAVERIGDLNIGVAAQALLILGAAAANLGIVALKCLVNFLQRLLALFGIGLRPVSQSTSGAEQHALGYEPYIESEMRLIEDPVEKAAELILQTADAIKDASTAAQLLPAGEGRAELIEALQKENVATAVNPLDDIFGVASGGKNENETADLVLPAQPEPLPDPIISLKQSGVEYIAAVRSLTAANQKPDCGVSAARENLSAAEKEYAAANVAFQPMKGKFRIFASPEKMRFLEAEKLVAAAQKNYEAAQDEQDRAPAPAVPAAVSARFQAARAALLNDGRSLVSHQLLEVEKIGEPEVKKFALARAASLKAALTQVLQVAALGELQKAILLVESTRVGVAAKLAEIEQLKLRQTHSARLAPAPDLERADAPRA